jgi:protein-tyrosine phosphatase
VYDVHCHILPNIDDGARDLKIALDMARLAENDGITHLACTPHIYPGLYENTPAGIAAAVKIFHRRLLDEGIDLELSWGADIQVVPELVSNMRSGAFPTINRSRYFLFEPPHHVPLSNFDQFVFDSVSAGFVPVITHPERLHWIDDHYEEFVAAVQAGAWIQLTAGSVTGRFGRSPRYWSEKMLDDGIVHLLATDAHNTRSRAPLLAEGALVAASIVGKEEAARLVSMRPGAIWEDTDPQKVPSPPGFNQRGEINFRGNPGFLGRLFRRL